MKFQIFHSTHITRPLLSLALSVLLFTSVLLGACTTSPGKEEDKTPLPDHGTFSFPVTDSKTEEENCYTLTAEKLLSPIRYNGTSTRHGFFRAFCEYAIASDAHTSGAVQAGQESSAYNQAYLNNRLTDALAALMLQPYLIPTVNPSYEDRVNDPNQALYAVASQLGGLGGKLYAGSCDIGILYRNRRTIGSDLYLYAYALLEDGVLTHFLSTDTLTDSGIPDGLSLLLLPAEQIVSLTAQQIQVLSDWIRNGGTLLFVGSPSQERTATALTELFAACGATLLLEQPEVTRDLHPLWSGKDPADSDPLLIPHQKIQEIRSLNLSSAETVLTLGGDPVGICQTVENGRLMAISLSHTILESSAAGGRFVRRAVCYAMNSGGNHPYITSPVIRAERGNYQIVRTLGESWTLEGAYLDLSDPSMTLCQNPTIAPESFGVFYPLPDFSQETEEAVLLYASGDCQESQEGYRLIDSSACLLLRAPSAKSPATVSVKDPDGNSILYFSHWDRETRLLSLSLYNRTPAIVSVTWQEEDTFRDVIPKKISLQVPTNQENLDREYLYFCNAGANSRLRFADGNTQIIYRFSLQRYPYATLTLQVLQNYLIEISPDGKNWTQIADYSQGGTVPHTTLGNNYANITVTPAMYGNWDELYVRIRNTDITQGWGGSITSFTLNYIQMPS